MALRYLQAIPEAPGLLFLPGSPSLLWCHLGLLLPAGKEDGRRQSKGLPQIAQSFALGSWWLSTADEGQVWRDGAKRLIIC